jgi:hypothetical protein
MSPVDHNGQQIDTTCEHTKIRLIAAAIGTLVEVVRMNGIGAAARSSARPARSSRMLRGAFSLAVH